MKKKSGFTITELIFAASVAVMTLAILFFVSFTLQDNIRLTIEILGLNENSRKSINIISRDIRKAESILTSFGTYTAGVSTLILRLPSIDSSGEIVTDASGHIASHDVIIYTLDTAEQDKLVRDITAAATSSRISGKVTVADNIDTFHVTSSSSESTGIEITTKAVLANANQGRLRVSCILRNNEREL